MEVLSPCDVSLLDGHFTVKFLFSDFFTMFFQYIRRFEGDDKLNFW